MSHGPRNEPPEDWRPAASFETLRRRAELLGRARSFFAARGVLEVETPLLASATVTDLHLASFEVPLGVETCGPRVRYLQTSPEFAMKRLVAAGSGAVYQICKAFRRGEAGRHHNPEFTILEWYRPGWEHHALIDEVDALLRELLGTPRGERLTYAELFRSRLGIDPHRAETDLLRELGARHGLDVANPESVDRDGWLQLLFARRIEPGLGRGRPSFVLDFPASQAALARLRDGDPPVAERFEAFVDGVELANGFHELADPGEQRRRFEDDLARRRRRGLDEVPVDERLLAALESGLPDCAGVALGFDRLVMLATRAGALADVLAFPYERA
jgi:lysyl-tRNA synthetase class 2